MWTPSFAPVPTVSVVVPAFNEAENIALLFRQLGDSLPAGAEVIVVDDSTDETPEIVRAVAPTMPFRVVLIHRDEPSGGLGGAVVEGLRAAAAEWAVVMDADLQHPPAVVPQLLAATEGHDLVVATRYAPGGNGDGLGSSYRHAVSRGAKRFAMSLLGGPVADMTDPLSGFFAVRLAALDLDRVNPVGYKILLELAVRCGLTRFAEVPFTFAPRHAGESKSTLREGLRFLRHLAMLRSATPRRAIRPATAPFDGDRRRDERPDHHERGPADRVGHLPLRRPDHERAARPRPPRRRALLGADPAARARRVPLQRPDRLLASHLAPDRRLRRGEPARAGPDDERRRAAPGGRAPQRPDRLHPPLRALRARRRDPLQSLQQHAPLPQRPRRRDHHQLRGLRRRPASPRRPAGRDHPVGCGPAADAAAAGGAASVRCACCSSARCAPTRAWTG